MPRTFDPLPYSSSTKAHVYQFDYPLLILFCNIIVHALLCFRILLVHCSCLRCCIWPIAIEPGGKALLRTLPFHYSGKHTWTWVELHPERLYFPPCTSGSQGPISSGVHLSEPTCTNKPTRNQPHRPQRCQRFQEAVLSISSSVRSSRQATGWAISFGLVVF